MNEDLHNCMCDDHDANDDATGDIIDGSKQKQRLRRQKGMSLMSSTPDNMNAHNRWRHSMDTDTFKLIIKLQNADFENYKKQKKVQYTYRQLYRCVKRSSRSLEVRAFGVSRSGSGAEVHFESCAAQASLTRALALGSVLFVRTCISSVTLTHH